MDDVYSKIKNYFTTNNICYREVKHDPGASAEDYHKALGCRYEQQLKSLLLKIYGNDKEYFAVLRADYGKGQVETFPVIATKGEYAQPLLLQQVFKRVQRAKNK